jgi:hypothetical protein
MAELFREKDTDVFFQNLIDEIRNRIDQFPDEKILNTDIDELTNYYSENNKIQPIVLFLDNITPELTETKIETNSSGYRTNQYDSQIYYTDGYKITYSIPFDGYSQLLYLCPAERILQRYFVDSIKSGNDTEYGMIIFSLTYKKHEMQRIETTTFVREQFNNQFRNYTKMIENVNKEVEHYNTTLQNLIKNALEKRKKKADEYIQMGEKLAIPLKIDPYAPNTLPILLKKVAVKKPEMPNMRPKEKEYTISTKDYENIRQIIKMAGMALEKTAKTFQILNEEGLRDYILSHLNAHYQGMATGETFSKTGKTDVYIPFDNKAAYIAECKNWYGEKNLKEALDQLFSYATWHDIKTSVIVFNKDNKDFKKILEKINTFLSKYELCLRKTPIAQNEWLCEFKKNKDASEIITVQIIAFDLCI